MEKFLKEKIRRNIWKSSRRIGLVAFLLFLGLNMTKIQSTNSFFMDEMKASGSQVKAGYWIPVIHKSVSPEDPDGKDGFYRTTPCVTLSAEIQGEEKGIKIYYEFSKDGNPIDGGIEYNGECVEIPDGNPTHFQAQAVNENNSHWKSNIISRDFKVKTHAEDGDVVINEIMWMGSSQGDNDEWIELKNTTDQDIDLKNWKIYGAAGGSGHLQIDGKVDDNYIIPAQGFFLISKYGKNKSAIDVTPDLVKGSLDFDDDYADNGKVILQDTDGNVIDETPVASKDSWPKGKHGILVPGGLMHLSMERNDNDEDWHTCNPLAMNHGQLETMRSYWDEGITRLFNCGTPGNENLSKDDPETEDLKSLFKSEENNPTPVIEEEKNKNVEEPIAPVEQEPVIDQPEPEIPVETPIEPVEDNVPEVPAEEPAAPTETPVDAPREESMISNQNFFAKIVSILKIG